MAHVAIFRIEVNIYLLYLRPKQSLSCGGCVMQHYIINDRYTLQIDFEMIEQKYIYARSNWKVFNWIFGIRSLLSLYLITFVFVKAFQYTIPGSHDSMTYGINRSSGLAPDAEPILHRLFPLFRGTILRWTITQANDTMQQLLLGIRYIQN